MKRRPAFFDGYCRENGVRRRLQRAEIAEAWRLWCRWGKCLDRAGLPHRPMHEMRHTGLTEFLRATGNLKLIQMLAGHADIGTTANIYAHLDTSDLETALRALNEEST